MNTRTLNALEDWTLDAIGSYLAPLKFSLKVLKRFFELTTARQLALTEEVVKLIPANTGSIYVLVTAADLAAIAGGVCYALNRVVLAGALVFFGVSFDVLDGVASHGRLKDKQKLAVMLYASVIDRVADISLFLGILFLFLTRGQNLFAVVAFFGLIGNALAPYIRARGAELGLDLKGGMFFRPERMVLLSAPQFFFGLAFDGWLLGAIIVAIAVGAWFTVVVRFRAFVSEARLPEKTATLKLETPSTESGDPETRTLRDRFRASRRLG